jgi:hypothetical protein
MFMRFRGVGHLGTRYLDSRLKEPEDNHDPGDGEQDEATLAGRHEDNSSYPHDERGDGIEEDSGPGTHEECTSRREPSNEEDENDKDGTEDEDEDKDKAEDEDDDENEDEDEDEDEDEGGDADNEQEVLGNIDDGQDLDGEDEEAMDDDEILDEEGFAEL